MQLSFRLDKRPGTGRSQRSKGGPTTGSKISKKTILWVIQCYHLLNNVSISWLITTVPWLFVVLFWFWFLCFVCLWVSFLSLLVSLLLYTVTALLYRSTQAPFLNAHCRHDDVATALNSGEFAKCNWLSG